MSQIRKQWAFYLNHSLRDLLRNGSRTFFALFCIATGVAAVVALRSLALMIADELTLNLAELNRGDIQISANHEFDPRYITRSPLNETLFTQAGVDALKDWATSEGVEIQFGSNENLLQMTSADTGQPIAVIPILVEPETWPYYGVVVSSEPEIRPLAELFPPDAHHLVMSRQTALRYNLQLGDQLIVAGQPAPLTLAYFVEDSTEGSSILQNGLAGLVGFIYYPLNRAADLGLEPLPERAYVRMPLGGDVDALDESLAQRFGKDIQRTTTTELRIQNEQTAGLINDLILVMGLSSILIGGIGIINTMTVIVGRRTLEIAVLKTLGLKAWRVTLLFLVEAALMGLIGSVIGVIAGVGLSYAVRNVGEEVLQSNLSWRPYPEAWFSGLTLGLVITIAFGFLPTLNAGQVRPIGVLRPNEITLPNAGLTRTLSALLVIMLVFGLTLNIIVSGRLELPFSLMLGLGGFIFGLFGGVMLANEGIMQPIHTQDAGQAARRGTGIFAGAIAVLSLIAIFGVGLLWDIEIHSLIRYGLPFILGAGLWFGLTRLNRPTLGLTLAKAARQLLLFGGALVLAGLVGGGIFVTWRALLAVLYPDSASSHTASILIPALIGLACFIGFRLRARGMAGLVGLALIGGMAFSVICFGVGDLITALFSGLPVWEDVQRVSAGIIIVEIIVLALGGAFSLILGVVWLISKMPAFGVVDIKLSLRNINARRSRTASTMMGLIAGIGALSLITLTTAGVTATLETQLETNTGGNVLIISRDAATAEAVKKRLDETIEGVNSYTQFRNYSGRIILIDGQEPQLDQLPFGDADDENQNDTEPPENRQGIGFSITAINLDNDIPNHRMRSGRFLTPEDYGQPVMTIREPAIGSFLYRLGVDLGSTITMRFRPPAGTQGEAIEITYTIIGVIHRDSEQTATADALQTPMGVLPDHIRPESIVTIADIQDEHVDGALRQFGQVSNTFALEIGFIVQLIQRLLDQLIAIPALVAALALVAGIAIIANTVALDTQERRQQIGVMKAVGLKGYRVLGQLVFENVVIGLVAGLIGMGIGVVATLLIGVLGDADEIGTTLHLWPALRLVLVAVIISVAATLVSAWNAARESPMQVLRYE